MLPSRVETKYGAYMCQKWSELYLTVLKNNLLTCHCYCVPVREHTHPASIHNGEDSAIQTEQALMVNQIHHACRIEVPWWCASLFWYVYEGLAEGCMQQCWRSPEGQNGGESGGRKERGGMGVIWQCLIYIYLITQSQLGKGISNGKKECCWSLCLVDNEWSHASNLI